MPSPLQINLLGEFHLVQNDQPILLPSPRQQALLAYLILYGRRPRSHQEVAEALWPAAAGPEAASALSDQIRTLQHHLPDGEEFLAMDGETVQWRADGAHTLDVGAFSEALDRAARAAEPVAKCAALAEAVDIYAGDLLPECPEAWVQTEREQLRRRIVEALAQLVDLLERQDDIATAVQYARRLRALSPGHEATFRRLVHLHVLRGERAAILDRLQRRLHAAAAGQGALVLIQGVAGIGKTSLALVAEKWAQDSGARFIVGRCHERGVTPAFSPWQEVMAALAGDAGEGTETLPRPFGAGPPVESAEELIQTVAGHLYVVASEQPLVLLLDDLHWASQDALDLLEFLTRHIEDHPLLILATYRPEEVQQAHPLHAFLPALQRDRPAETIELLPLDFDGTNRLIEGNIGPCHPQLARDLHDRAEGHPLFLTELLNDLVDQNLLTQEGLGRWLPPDQDIPVPNLLRQVIVQRSARLGESAATFLSVAAVVGEEWELAVVEALLDWREDELLAVLRQVLAVRIVEEIDVHQERYRFTHGLIREVLYTQQLPRRRRRTHAQVAELLERERSPEPALDSPAKEAMQATNIEALAHHHYQAGNWPQALQYSLRAGHVARSRNANHSALRFYRQALNAAGQQREPVRPDTYVDLYARVGEICLLLNHKEDARNAYTSLAEAAQTAADKRAQTLALIQLAECLERTYAPRKAEETRQMALALAEELGDPHLLALSYCNFGHQDIVKGNLARVQQYVARAEEHARAIDDPELLATSLRFQGYVAVWWGQYEKAEQLVRAQLHYAQAAGNPPLIAHAHWLLGFTLTEQGRYESARQFLQEGLAYVEDLGNSHAYIARLRNNLGYLHRELGDLESAEQWHQRALTENRQGNGYHTFECACYTLLDLAAVHLAAGRQDAAEAHFREFESIRDQTEYGRFRYLNRSQLFLAELALARGDYPRAREVVAQALELAEAKGMRKNLVKCRLYEGRALLGLHRPEEAAAHLSKAVTLADAIAHGSLRWQTRLRLAEAQEALGQPNQARYREALQLVEDTAERLQDETLRATFLDMPLVLELKVNTHAALQAQQQGRTAPAAPHPAGLTDREVEVLQLIAQGHTDRQIAATLHIAVRTASTHVTSILNKTASDNRTAAATFAARHGLL